MSEDRPDSFASLFEGSAVQKARSLRVGERLEGKVILVGKDAVFVEVDGKREAYIEAVELRAPDGTLSVKVGDTIVAQVVSVEEGTGQVRLGRSGAMTGDVSSLQRAREAGLAVEGKVTGVNKGGLEVDVAGHRAFCPLSQVDRRPGGDPKELVGQTLAFLITEVRDGGRNVVVSRRAIQEREAREAAQRPAEAQASTGEPAKDGAPAAPTAASGPAVGAIVRGKVDHIETYGIFVQLDGIQGRAGRGLIPTAELGVARGTDLRKAFPEGAPVVAKILETGDRKLRLSIKGAKDDEERAQFEESKSKVAAPKTLGTLGDLLKKRGH